MLHNRVTAKEDATTTFGSNSRKRKLPTISFVYPKRQPNGIAQPYRFGDTQQEASNSKPPEPEQTLDDILYPHRNQQQQRNQETLKKGDSKPPPATSRTSKNASTLHDLSAAPLNGQDDNFERSPYLSGVSVAEAVQDKIGLRPRANSTDGELLLPQRGLCDERKVLANYQWTTGNYHNKTNAPPTGLNNLGNTCFLNSTLQCLAHCPPFCQSLMDLPSNGRKDASNNNNKGKKFTLLLSGLFHKVHGGREYQHSTTAVSPRGIVNSVPGLGGGRNGYTFRPGRQEDAHEFLVHLLDAMHDGELKEAGINVRKSGWRDRLPAPRLDETTFVHRIFGGYFRSQVQCTMCGYCSNTYDPFLDLSLEISSKSCRSIGSALHEFTRKETLDRENRWRCSGCKKRVCANKQLTVFRPPLALCIQLKRFAYGGLNNSMGYGSFGGRMGGNKISKPIEFPAHMKLPLSDGRSCAYSLTGIIIHVGSSASSGHYTACVKKPSKKGARWYHMDDSYVQAVSEQEVLRQRDAYVLFYSRKEVVVEYPSPPMSSKEAVEFGRAKSRARAESIDSKVAASSGAIGPMTYTEAKDAALISKELQQVEEGQPHDVAPKKDDCIPTSIGAKPESIGRDSSAPRPKEPDEGNSSSSSSSSEGDDSKSPSQRLDPKNLDSASRTSSGSSSSSESSTSSGSSSDSSNRKDNIVENDHSSSSGDSDLSDSVSSPIAPKNLCDDCKSFAKTSTEKEDKKKPDIVHVSLDRGENGKVEVAVGRRSAQKRVWKPKVSTTGRGAGYDLLGNMPINKWDNEEQDTEAVNVRTKVSKQMDLDERNRKRKMFVDRHDAMLDMGKVCSWVPIGEAWLQHFLLRSGYSCRQQKSKKRRNALLVGLAETTNSSAFKITRV